MPAPSLSSPSGGAGDDGGGGGGGNGKGGGRAHGAVLLSSSPVEAQVTEGSLSLRVLLAPGSALELALLPGPTPADVSDQMTRLLGRPALPPAFALGTHQSR